MSINKGTVTKFLVGLIIICAIFAGYLILNDNTGNNENNGAIGVHTILNVTYGPGNPNVSIISRVPLDD